jgi:shikimate kinase
LQTANPLARLTDLYQQRDPLYRQTADLVFNTNGQHVHTIAQVLWDELQVRNENH